MQSKSLILLVVALACGVVASIGITKVMAHRSAAPAAQEMETLPVYVIKEDLPLGSLLDADKLKLERWPKDKVPTGVIGKLEDIEGRRPRTKLFAGEPVLEVKLLSKGESAGGAAVQIPMGLRSVPVKVDEVSGGAAMILPGDRVDVLVYARQSKEIQTTMTKTILQDIKVFAVDSTWTLESDENGQSIRAKTISLLLTPEQTERVMLASELGKIRLAMRSPNDHEEAELPDEGHQVGQIFGESQLADRNKDSVLAMSANSQPQLPSPTNLQPQLPVPDPVDLLAPERPSHKVRVIAGSQVQEVVMENQSDVPESETPGAAAPQGNPPASFLWKIISGPPSMTGGGGASAQNAEPKPDAKPDTNPAAGSAPEPVAEPTSSPAEPAEPEDARVPS